MKTLVISDLHIGSKGCQTEAILKLLEKNMTVTS
jgi:UDP-2,3-diacylglucosamine pyrophosphatase LpxH